MMAQQQGGGEQAVRRQNHPEDQKDLRRGPDRQHFRCRLYPLEGQGGQHPPRQGKLGTDPPPDMARQGPVVPEPGAKGLVVEEVDQIFHSGADYGAQRRRGPEAGPRRDQGQQRRHGQAVDRTQGQQQKALAHLFFGADRPGEQLFQAIACKTVKKKEEKPSGHGGAPFPYDGASFPGPRVIMQEVIAMTDSWEALARECAGCRECALCQTRHNVVFGVGNTQAEVILVGEGPGAHEDEQGVPFVGRAGQLLDSMLAIIGLDRTNVYIANIVKCRPPGNRDPLNVEQDACIGYLRRQIALLQPKILVCLGRIAAMRLIDPKFRITKDHGQWYDRDGLRVMAIYHPSALLRDPSKRPETFDDLKVLQQEIRRICPRTAADWRELS